jgi:hypothetical protein
VEVTLKRIHTGLKGGSILADGLAEDTYSGVREASEFPGGRHHDKRPDTSCTSLYEILLMMLRLSAECPLKASRMSRIEVGTD